MPSPSKVPPRKGQAASSRRTAVPPRGGKGRPNRPSGGARGRQAAFQARKRRNRNIGLGVVGGVIVVVVVLVIVAVTGGSGGGSSTKPAPALAVKQVSSVPVATLAAAANGYQLESYPSALSPAGTKTTVDGKPELVYIGAEYCPYCAAQRWGIVAALAKFGTFTGLKQIASSPTDVNPSTPTFSFLGATYTSQYLAFTSRETETVSEKPLQTLDKAEKDLETKYDTSEGIPFLYYGGLYDSSGSYYNGDENVLSGMSFNDIAAAVAKGNSTAASNIDATAGVMISLICQMTNGQPGTVCSHFPKAITSGP